jgi:hypothetical protein
MISKKSLVAVLDKSIILTITAPNDNANQDPVQCAPPPLARRHSLLTAPIVNEIELSCNRFLVLLHSVAQLFLVLFPKLSSLELLTRVQAQ